MLPGPRGLAMHSGQSFYLKTKPTPMRQSPLILHDTFTFPGGGERVAAVLAPGIRGHALDGRVRPRGLPPGLFLGPPAHGHCAPGSATPSWPATRTRPACGSASAASPSPPRPSPSSAEALAPMAHRRVTGAKILYCHTPPRILYDQRAFYMERQPHLKRPLYQGLPGQLRALLRQGGPEHGPGGGQFPQRGPAPGPPPATGLGWWFTRR